jgi:hypothetical protein
MANLTKKGALSVTQTIDRIATVVASEYVAFGISPRVAEDFAKRCDMISDHIERKAGMDPEDEEGKKAALKQALSGQPDHKVNYPTPSKGFDAESIGVETSGRHEGDGDEPYMNGEFTQQENRELRDTVESRRLPGVTTDPRAPRPGVQASFAALAATLKSAKLDEDKEEEVKEAFRLAAAVVEAAKKAEDGDDGEDEGTEAAKKASHGFDLFA